jgi:hypothetical protein
MLGTLVGMELGCIDGDNVGCIDGSLLGVIDGAFESILVGSTEGVSEGNIVGVDDGAPVGVSDGDFEKSNLSNAGRPGIPSRSCASGSLVGNSIQTVGQAEVGATDGDWVVNVIDETAGADKAVLVCCCSCCSNNSRKKSPYC